MAGRITAPFRADHVGSFLRPKFLLDARDQFKQGAITRAQLREVEDRAIRDVVKFQEDLGLQGITDGEYRRTYFHIDFLEKLDGVNTTWGEFFAKFKRDDGSEVGFRPPTLHVDAPIRHSRPIQGADFEFLAKQTSPARRYSRMSPRRMLTTPVASTSRGHSP